jgi:hypothetical protein
MFGDYIDRIYPDEGDIKNTTLLLGLFHILIYTYKLTVTVGGRLRTKRYDKRDGIELSHYELSIYAYIETFEQHLNMEYVYKLIRYSIACGSYKDFLNRELLVTRKLLHQGFLVVMLKSVLWSP